MSTVSTVHGAKLEELLRVPGSLTSVTTAPGEPDKLYLVRKEGLVSVFDRKTGTVLDEPFLDIRGEMKELYEKKPLKVSFADERGLLRLAFHPEYSSRGSLFRGVFLVTSSRYPDPEAYDVLSASQVTDPDNMTCVSQFVNRGSAAETLKTRIDILCIPEPEANHNGGMITFDSDGYLWIGFGDGGGANDQHGELLQRNNPESFLGNAQNKQSFHGKLLRIEVVQPMPQATKYMVPPTNPFYGKPNLGRPEIAAWGFRNPWSEHLPFIGDVGQNRFESVKVVTALGENHGWRAFEGNELFSPDVADYISKKGEKIVKPILTYGLEQRKEQEEAGRSQGTAITGIHYYRGLAIESLYEKLVVADYSGQVYIASSSDEGWSLQKFVNAGMFLSGMGRDRTGEGVYVLGFDIKTMEGVVLQLLPTNPRAAPPLRLTVEDVQRIIDQGVSKAMSTNSGIRKEASGVAASAKMHFAVILRGEESGTLVHSMQDAWDGSKDIAKKKAHTAMAFSSDENALTSRTIGILSQPGAPLWQIGNSNPGGGVIEFPGGIPLYKGGRLVGGVGVSGDVVDVDEAVAVASAVGFEPNVTITSEQIGVEYTKTLTGEEEAKARREPTLARKGAEKSLVNDWMKGLLAISEPRMDGSSDIGSLDMGKVSMNYTIRSLEALEAGNRNATSDAAYKDVNTVSIDLNGDKDITSVSMIRKASPAPLLGRITEMNLFTTSVSSITKISDFTGLVGLNLSRTLVDNRSIGLLSRMTRLVRLELNGNDIDDISALSTLTSLRRFGIACTDVSDIKVVESMSVLEELDLYQTRAVLHPEGAPMVILPSSLRVLDIRKTPIEPEYVLDNYPGISRLFS